MDCEQAWAVFPTDRVLVAGRWRAAYQFGLVDVAGEDPSELALGARQPAQPVVMRRIGGSAQADLLETDWATLLLVSDRLVALLRAASATGWCLFPVDLRAQGDRPVDGYHGLGITGRAGPIKPELGRDVVLPPPVPDGNPVPAPGGGASNPGRGTEATCSPRRERKRSVSPPTSPRSSAALA